MSATSAALALARDLDLTQASSPHSLAAALLVFARMLPLGLLAATRAPWPVALAIPAALALGLLPSALAHAHALPVAPLALLALAPRELLLGALYALWLLLPLSALDWAGRLTGLSLRAPDAERSVAALYLALAAAAFFVLGGHRLALHALGSHLRLDPIGQLAVHRDLAAAALGSVALAAQALEVAVALALPALAAMALAELAVALLSRGSGSSLPLALLPLRPLLGLSLLLGSLTLLVSVLPALFEAALRAL